MRLTPKAAALFYRTISALVFLVAALRSALIPFAHDEVATFLYYIQPGDFWPFLSHPDANGHFLTNMLGWISYGLFGPSPFALRLPSLLSLVVLVYALWRFRKLFSSDTAWLVLAGGLLLSFNFVGFYALCRGYGISMAFFVLAMYYLFEYIVSARARHFVKSVVFLQLALAANLTLLPATFLCTVILLWAMRNTWREQKIAAITTLLLHGALIYFWARFGMFLKAQGALYYGAGDSYWKTTFESLLMTVAAAHPAVSFAAIAGMIWITVRSLITLIRKGLVSFMNHPGCLSWVMFVALVVGFYLMKRLGGVNYPEDRTALFFYVVWLVSVAFHTDRGGRFEWIMTLAIPLYFLFHFPVNMNLRVHPWPIYETIPNRFVDKLIGEQSRVKERITVGGHRIREFIYGFRNYLTGGRLNHCTSPEALAMNCDYALAVQKDSAWYSPYYNVIDAENDWGFRLLKRKKPINRELIIERGSTGFNGAPEYANACELTGMEPGSHNPLLAEFEMVFRKAPVPLNAWLVLQVDAVSEDSSFLVRTPLNLVKEDWNNSGRHHLGIVSPVMPLRIKRFVAYLWNIEKKPLDFSFEAFRLYRLHGEGVTVESKAKL
jgi:hypothetical protein